MPLPDARTAVREHLAGRITHATLFRSLMTHVDWHVPVHTSPEGEAVVLTFVDAAGERWIKVFTDLSAVEAWVAQEGKELDGQCLVTDGANLFGALDAELAGVEINPGLPEGVHYQRQHIPLLQQWARIIELESALETIDAGETPIGLLRDYDAYVLVLKRTGADSAQLVLAPDADDRMLAAVFTAEDTLAAFFDQVLASADFEPIPVRVNGEQLFTQLQTLPLDGLVFNCSGPTQPRAFGKRLADYVLSRGDESGRGSAR
ncbi:MAG: SseB family protein [Chloracidobacterium sp.]|uniref:SseB family protein n=1 Tax=Chloracidobacterium validum TaxID=2821543 RepID=A0ABX8B8T6_9BACT|nr:SseB family protein [Chloracidobacterium validum]QUW03303.1 SseB family protein [Chloracidobacterium validum]